MKLILSWREVGGIRAFLNRVHRGNVFIQKKSVRGNTVMKWSAIAMLGTTALMGCQSVDGVALKSNKVNLDASKNNVRVDSPYVNAQATQQGAQVKTAYGEANVQGRFGTPTTANNAALAPVAPPNQNFNAPAGTTPTGTLSTGASSNRTGATTGYQPITRTGATTTAPSAPTTPRPVNSSY